MIGLVYSVNDPAGRGIADYIVKELGLREARVCGGSTRCFIGESVLLAGFDEDVVYLDFLDEVLPSELRFYVVLSRHSSEAGVKSYTVHTPGNFSKQALHGGRPRELGIAFPSVKWFLLRALNKLATDFAKRNEYEVSYEATHHGPTSLSKPIVFIEIGSTINEWTDPANHAVLGEAVSCLLQAYPRIPECAPVIGIGGGHYARKHTEISMAEKTCYGHIASKHALDHLDIELLQAMILRTKERVKGVVIEKKSTRREHRLLVEEFLKSTTDIILRYV